MSNPFRTPEDYELFLYTLMERFPSIRRSTVIFIRRGATLGRVSGELHFDGEFRLVVRERILYQRHPVLIDWDGYEIWQGHHKLCWYDSQAHPDDLTLVSTDPHHKHVSPDVKHHRIPAPHMSFHRPNIPILIQEIENLFKEGQRKKET